MDYIKVISKHLRESAKTKERIIENCTQNISEAAREITACFKNNGKLLICGNGGSAADAQHIAAEFVVRLSHDLVRPALPAIALTTDTSLLTAAANDIGFDNVFARQVEALGRKNDVFIGITTSGNSENILRAAIKAKQIGLRAIAFLGGDGGKAIDFFDIKIIIPSSNVQHIQEGHITIGHIICELVERDMYT